MFDNSLDPAKIQLSPVYVLMINTRSCVISDISYLFNIHDLEEIDFSKNTPIPLIVLFLPRGLFCERICKDYLLGVRSFLSI